MDNSFNNKKNVGAKTGKSGSTTFVRGRHPPGKNFPAKDGRGFSKNGNFNKFNNKDGKNFSNKNAKGNDVQENGKTDWNKLKSDMKSLREVRKKKKKQNFYDSYQEAKKLWEKLRTHTCKPNEKEELCSQILNLIKGKIKMIVKCHDMARIVQWLLKLGSESVREQVFSEISDDMVNLSKNKYTKHAVKSLLQHCSPSVKKQVLNKCSGKIYNMTCNKVSAPLVEEMFKIAGPAEKSSMIKEFCGGIACDINLDSNIAGDEVTLALLSKGTKFLNTLIDKGHCLEMNLVHSVIYDYLQKCSAANKTDMVNNLKTHFRSFLSSKDGIRLFAMILWASTAKEKKNIVKEFKSDLKEIAVGEHSSLALLLLLDSVDDTVLIKKAIVPGLLENLETIVTDEHGRKIFIYLMVHRDKKYFHPKDIEWLSQLDSSPNVKKDSELKITEIQESLLVPILDKIKVNAEFWFRNSSISMVTRAIINTSKGESRISALSSIAEYITDSKSTVSENDKIIPIIEHPGTHMVLKKIIAHDKTVQNELETFSHILVKSIDDSTIENWLKSNRGCFTLVAIFETNLANVVQNLKKKMSKWSNKLENNNKGSQVLKKIISS